RVGAGVDGKGLRLAQLRGGGGCVGRGSRQTNGQQTAGRQQRGRQSEGPCKWGDSRMGGHMAKSLDRRRAELAVRAIDPWVDQLAGSHLPQLRDREEQKLDFGAVPLGLQPRQWQPLSNGLAARRRRATIQTSNWIGPVLWLLLT